MRRDPFTSILIEKLNQLKRDQEVREKLEESLEQFQAFGAKISKNRKKKRTVTTKDKATETVQEAKTPLTEHLTKQNRVQNLKKRFEEIPKSKAVQFENNPKISDFVTVGYCFAGNPVPYSTKVRGKRISLGHFKTLVNKRGDHRYFFKRYSNEFGTNIVFEEVTDDEEILPLWDGKIFGLIEEIEEYRL